MQEESNAKPRWLYRFDNYSRAFKLLREIVEAMAERPFNQFEKEAIIQRFEYTWELAWKTLKDYLEYKGVVLETITPNATIKAAYAAKIINNGDVWMKALDARNLMAHTYDFQSFEKITIEIKEQYLFIFEDLYMFLLKEVMDKK